MPTQADYDKVFIERITRILEANLENERFGVKELADAAAVSRSQLHRKVHAYNNNSTSQFIREYRLMKAKDMLQKNGITVAEIAYKVGFSSPTYFNTCFKEYYGFSPGETKFHESNSQPKGFQQKRVWYLSVVLIVVVLMGYTSFYYLWPEKKQIEEIVSLVPAERTIAVLPFKNWSGDPENEYISDGMTDAIITRLTQIKSMKKVVPFTSVVGYKNSNKSIPTIAEELEVENVLQGNIQFAGDQVKITLQLVEGKTDSHLWSHEYAGTWMSDEIFAIQSNVAENVAKRMNIKVGQEEFEAINQFPTNNKEAYNYFLKANYQAFKYTKEGMENAVPFYKKAISLDPAFSDAYVNLAYLYLLGGAHWGLFTEQEAWYNAKELLLKASEIDSTNIDVKSALLDGSYIYEWDYEAMEKNYKTLSKVSGVYTLQTGRYKESLAILNQMYAENPNLVNFAFRARTLFFLDRREEARDLLEFSDDVFSDDITYLKVASTYYYYLGEYKKSKALLDKIIANYSDRPPLVLWLGALHAYRDGDMESLDSLLNQLEERYDKGMSGSPAWFTALYYSSIGDRENAFFWLQKSYDKHEVELIWLREEPALRPLRADKRYKRLYKKVGFPMPPHDADN